MWCIVIDHWIVQTMVRDWLTQLAPFALHTMTIWAPNILNCCCHSCRATNTPTYDPVRRYSFSPIRSYMRRRWSMHSCPFADVLDNCVHHSVETNSVADPCPVFQHRLPSNCATLSVRPISICSSCIVPYSTSGSCSDRNNEQEQEEREEQNENGLYSLLTVWLPASAE